MNTTMKIVELGKMFRPGTSHVYPPFKKGRYMEEFMYEYLLARKNDLSTDWVYLPVFWTNLQNHPGFSVNKAKYQMLLDQALLDMPSDTKYFTIVQHDDGPLLKLPPQTDVFGACTGTIPLPLIYEDTSHTLLTAPRLIKTMLASFVGTKTTHPLRGEMVRHLEGKQGIQCQAAPVWKVNVVEQDAARFVEWTLRSKFCLAPRGYGRSSFRFFEAMQLDTIPVYLWDDVEWIPYKDILDYSTFAISISHKDLPQLYDRLRSISEDTYRNMQQELLRVRHHFTLEGMAEYIVGRITRG
jgi:hypothetical protein